MNVSLTGTLWSDAYRWSIDGTNWLRPWLRLASPDQGAIPVPIGFTKETPAHIAHTEIIAVDLLLNSSGIAAAQYATNMTFSLRLSEYATRTIPITLVVRTTAKADQCTFGSSHATAVVGEPVFVPFTARDLDDAPHP